MYLQLRGLCPDSYIDRFYVPRYVKYLLFKMQKICNAMWVSQGIRRDLAV